MNIWEIVTLNDLVKILKEHEKRFVIVAITLDSTPQKLTKNIKKFLKHYAKLYENLTFLYYKAERKDLGRISLLNKDENEYPFIYHVYDTSEIFVSVNRANEDTIYEAFNAVEEYYKKDLQSFLLNKTNKNDSNKNDSNKNESNIVLNDRLDISNDKLKQDDITAEMNRKAMEHQKLLERISIFERKKELYNTQFLEDIKKRKTEEQKK